MGGEELEWSCSRDDYAREKGEEVFGEVEAVT